MKIKDLINYLSQEGIDKNSSIFLTENDGISWDFTGINTDDGGNVEIYVCVEDKEA